MKILMVCLGNICRSPLAEGILKSKLPDHYIVDSAGTIAMHEGEHPDKRSVKVAALHNIDISKQRSRPIQPKDLEYFDRIYCMDRNNLKDVSAMAKNEGQRQKISLILDVLHDNNNTEVPDPYWGNQQDFEDVFQLLNKACDIIKSQLPE
ncbi:low molecular weight phosphotyrosine protein phosphatase [Elizabethkingia anophelis]|uniref:low molecular weight protein-tyrosine-phosphatase n=1 Tax=Elizabethkingia anophelis TaxID=1117645 RepID=UPI000442C862|nr:low molecular weight protein-tyrosine-phosphatase [Elizabethkingia anophelis]AQW99382.1 protein-tyrosine-phosphatase [Elizabethkingia anophelis]AQX89928.1 protein-tyrosine-phosphatase [Elizabethkingia anophelis]ASV79248.1 low molecular weight phosphotyrosine protein phosphatase [Elizabethkingia anophelis]EHM7980303.1 low molecular weight phosphotyrosine protein phosphatase [Elizabethkingia anophelis]EHM8031522.1 low molecular weight phosphotyrosine protein phosphatase [Elizabethkingia anoph